MKRLRAIRRWFGRRFGYARLACVGLLIGVAALRAVASRRQEIAAFIRKVVENWDTETLIMRIELQVGRDLQFIRINGTVVGGLVGLLIFSVSRWL